MAFRTSAPYQAYDGTAGLPFCVQYTVYESVYSGCTGLYTDPNLLLIGRCDWSGATASPFRRAQRERVQQGAASIREMRVNRDLRQSKGAGATRSSTMLCSTLRRRRSSRLPQQAVCTSADGRICLCVSPSEFLRDVFFYPSGYIGARDIRIFTLCN